MCQKCESFHSKLLPNHKIYNIDKINLEEISQQLCNEEKHNLELQYFCKNHNVLCCAKCITKIKNKENGLHKDCDIYTIEEIKEEKINKLNKNINNLELLSKNLEESINKLKDIFEKLNKNKEDVKTNIQRIFTKIRNELNSREDSLLIEVDDIYNKNFFGEDIIKQGEKLPNKIKRSLEKCKTISNFNEENKIISLINECLTIENSIDEINKINDSINKCNNLTNIDIVFYPKEENDTQINDIIQNINHFGQVFKSNDLFVDSSIIGKDVNKHCILIKDNNETDEEYIEKMKSIFTKNKKTKAKKCEIGYKAKMTFENKSKKVWPIGYIKFKIDKEKSKILCKDDDIIYPDYEIGPTQDGDFYVVFDENAPKGNYSCTFDVYIGGNKLENAKIELTGKIKSE